MKYRTKKKLKSKKRKGCWANKFERKSSVAADKNAPTCPDDTPSSSVAVNTVNNKDVETVNNTINNVNQIFSKITNKSAEKIAANSILNKDLLARNNEKPIPTRSRKRKLDMQAPLVNKTQQAAGSSIIKLSQLQTLLDLSSVCEKCKVGKLILCEDIRNRKGLAQNIFTKCKHCLKTVFITISKRAEPKKPFDVNLKSAHASCQGLGYAGLKKMCTSFDLPKPVGKGSFNKLCTSISSAATETASSSISNAADRLFKITEKENPSNIIVLPGGRKVANVAVSVDGTWQKRGHTSRIGVVFIISIETGEVLDFVIKSLICHVCSAHKHLVKGSDEHKDWWATHEQNCTINHEGSSDSMESQGAVEIFLRSIDKHQLQYTTFIGDGDSNCFGSCQKALESAPIPYNIQKEECVGHIQKRMGAALRKFKKDNKGVKLADGKSVSGAGRLTDDLINRIQNYFGQCIRNNSGNLGNMRNNVWAIFQHIVIDDTKSMEEQHSRCPREGWCKFWANKEKYIQKNRLPSVFTSSEAHF